MRRAAARVGRAGLRSARLRADRFRRRGAVARQRAREADQQLAGHRASGPRRALRLRRRDDPAAQRGVAHPGSAVRERCPTPQVRSILADLEQDAAKALAAEGVESAGQETTLSDRHALRRAGDEADRRHDAGRISAPKGLLASRSASTACTSSSSPSRSTPATSSSDLRAVVLGPQKPFIGDATAARRRRSEGRGDAARPGVYVGDGWREGDDLRPRQARSRQPHRGAGDRGGNGRDDADPARLHRDWSTTSATFSFGPMPAERASKESAR